MLTASCKALLSPLQCSASVTHVGEGTALTALSPTSVEEARENPREGQMSRERQAFCWVWGQGMAGGEERRAAT